MDPQTLMQLLQMHQQMSQQGQMPSFGQPPSMGQPQPGQAPQGDPTFHFKKMWPYLAMSLLGNGGSGMFGSGSLNLLGGPGPLGGAALHHGLSSFLGQGE